MFRVLKIIPNRNRINLSQIYMCVYKSPENYVYMCVYIYMYIYVCVCVCVCMSVEKKNTRVEYTVWWD